MAHQRRNGSRWRVFRLRRSVNLVGLALIAGLGAARGAARAGAVRVAAAGKAAHEQHQAQQTDDRAFHVSNLRRRVTLAAAGWASIYWLIASPVWKGERDISEPRCGKASVIRRHAAVKEAVGDRAGGWWVGARADWPAGHVASADVAR